MALHTQAVDTRPSFSSRYEAIVSHHIHQKPTLHTQNKNQALLPSGIQKSREWKRNGNWKRKLEIELKKKNENTTF